MQLYTPCHIATAEVLLQRHHRVVTVGSCFAEVIGGQLLQQRMSVEVNPFGTLFSPLALAHALTLALRGQQPDPRHLFQRDDLWLHHDFPAAWSGASPEALLDRLTTLCQTQGQNLAQTDWLLLTLGTAFSYQLQETQLPIANCHKRPAAAFRRDLLSVKHICQVLGQLFLGLQKQFPELRIVLTVSPVRHTKDGLAENAVSKAILRAACHYLETDFSQVAYFPAYELMVDELRDYRFYREDLIHPNEMAEKYIFERFGQAYFSFDLADFIKAWQPLRQRMAHRPFNPDSEQHRRFLAQLAADKRAFEERFGTKLDD
jgi:GSCFA family